MRYIGSLSETEGGTKSRKRRLRGSLGEVRMDNIYQALEDVLVEVDRIYVSVNAVKDCLEADFYEESRV